MRTPILTLLLCNLFTIAPAEAQEPIRPVEKAPVAAETNAQSSVKRVQKHGQKRQKRMEKKEFQQAKNLRFADRLSSLTPEQKTQIETLQKEFKTKSKAMREKLKVMRLETKEEGANDETRANAQQNKKEISELRNKIWNQMTDILSKEQVAELDTMSATLRDKKKVE